MGGGVGEGDARCECVPLVVSGEVEERGPDGGGGSEDDAGAMVGGAASGGVGGSGEGVRVGHWGELAEWIRWGGW